MTKKILFLLIFLIVFSCKKEKNIFNEKNILVQKPTIKIQDSIFGKDSISIINNKTDIGFYEDFEQKLKLHFDSIPEFEFKKNDNNKLFFKNTNFKKDKSNICLEINKHIQKFKIYKDYGVKESWSGYECLGFYDKLNLFALTNASVAESLGFSELFLIDKQSGFQYNIVSIGDSAVQLPIPSPDNKFMVYWHNTEYEHQNSEIRVLKINQKSKAENLLTEFASFGTDKFAVEKIIWISNNSFYVKGYKEVYDGSNWIKNYSYHKTNF